MNKNEFIDALRLRLADLPSEELDERIGFYVEMIDDRIEEGLDEEAAVAEIGSVDSISGQILADIPLSKIAKSKIKKRRRMRAWEIVLLAVGSPIWASLLIAAFAIIISLYAVLWSLVAVAWSVFGAFGGCSLGGIAAGVLSIVHGEILIGIAFFGVSLVLAGLGIFLFFGCMAATKGTVTLTKKIVLGIKKCFVRKENA